MSQTDISWKFQHPDEHGRYPLAVSDPLRFNDLKRTLRIKLGHDVGGSTHLQSHHRVAKRRRVVKRGGAQVAGVGVVAEQRTKEAHQHGRCL